MADLGYGNEAWLPRYAGNGMTVRWLDNMGRLETPVRDRDRLLTADAAAWLAYQRSGRFPTDRLSTGGTP